MGVMETLCFATILIFTASSQSDALSITRRSTHAQNPNDLTAALDVLQRRRRQITNTDFIRAYLQNQNGVAPYRNEYLDDKYISSSWKYPQKYSPLTDEDKMDDIYSRNNEYKRTFKRARTVPSQEELADIFGNLNQVAERTHKRHTYRDTIPPVIASREDGQHGGRSTRPPEEHKKVQQSKLNKMFSDDQKDVNNVENENNARQKVSKEELNDVFSENPEPDVTETKSTPVPDVTTTAATISENPPQTSEGERFQKLNSYVNLANIKRNKKSVKKREYDSDIELSQTVLGLTNEVAALKDEVARLKVAGALEDKENDLLASALKQATLGQLKGSAGNLEKEFHDISRAIRVEEMLQSVKSPEEIAEDLENQENSDGELYIENIDSSRGDGLKRSFADNSEKVYHRPDSNEEDMEQRQADDELLRNFATAAENQQRNLNIEQDEINGQNEALDDLISDLTPSERQQVLENYLSEESREQIANSGNCPGVNYLSSQCSIAKLVGLNIDDEATYLCNRHEMCYTCGGTLSLSQSTCDAGFRSDVIQMCGEKPKCIKDGARFLWFIKSEHTYNYGYLDKCDSTCVKDFISGQ